MGNACSLPWCYPVYVCVVSYPMCVCFRVCEQIIDVERRSYCGGLSCQARKRGIRFVADRGPSLLDLFIFLLFRFLLIDPDNGKEMRQLPWNATIELKPDKNKANGFHLNQKGVKKLLLRCATMSVVPPSWSYLWESHLVTPSHLLAASLRARCCQKFSCSVRTRDLRMLARLEQFSKWRS